MKHKHHIIPKYLGGSDDPDNIVEVYVEEHANLHLALYLEHGRVGDWVAYHGLMKVMSKEECIKTIQREEMRRGWKTGRYKYTDEWRKNVSQANKRRGAKIHCVDLNKTWICAKDAAQELGLNEKCLYEYARGAKKGTYGGYTFIRLGKVERRRHFNQPQ